MIERRILERERMRVSLEQGGRDPGSLEVPAGELELRRLDVDTVEADAGELLPEDGKHCADAAPTSSNRVPGSSVVPSVISRCRQCSACSTRRCCSRVP
jgi:hypothetical protein